MFGRNTTRKDPPTVTISAPVGGWNKRDALSEMKPTDAIQLDNVIPDTLGVVQRRGYAAHATGITGNFAESLMEYNAASGNPQLFAGAPANIFEVTAAGAVGAAVVTGLSNGRWQHTMFSTTGGDFLVACNGADDVRNYNGSVWSTPTINNVTSSSLVSVYSHMRRLWFIENASLSVWYLPSLNIAGNATEFDLSEVSKKGGELLAMGSWSRDGGEGMDDVAVFVTSRGEIHLYEGQDPDDADTWKRIGTFNAPEPIGRRCLIKIGADLCYLSSQGVLPLPQFLGMTSANASKSAVTDKISGAFREAYFKSGTSFGWEIVEYPKENLLIVNVPIRERVKTHQYVMNLRTGAWCRFTNINALCWSLKGDALYFGGIDGKVYAYGGAGIYSDDGDPIEAVVIPAFSNFGTPKIKKFTLVRPLMNAPPGYRPQIKLLLDYDADFIPSFSPESFTSQGTPWGSPWGSPWAVGSKVFNKILPVRGTGTTAAIALATSSTRQVRWNSTQVQFEIGRVA